MSTIARSLIALAMVSSALVSFELQAQVDSAMWTTFTEPTPYVEGNPRAKFSGQTVVITVPAASVDGPTGVFGAGLRSVCSMPGDFDIQVSYTILGAPTLTGVRFAVGNSDAFAARDSFSSHDSFAPGEFFAHGVSPFILVSTRSFKGSLRLLRQGSNVRSYYKAPLGSWKQIGTGTSTGQGGFAIWAWSHNYAFADAQVKIRVDAVDVAGQWAGPGC